MLTKANNLYHAVGSSTANCDTVLGRQCMASYYFMLREFEEVIIYLNSVKTYMSKLLLTLYHSFNLNLYLLQKVMTVMSTIGTMAFLCPCVENLNKQKKHCYS